MAISINRTVYIGIGGTGAETLAKIKRHFIDAYGTVPQPMIGFLAIDTQTGINKIAVAKDKYGKNVALDTNELCIVSVPNALDTYRKQKTNYTWMPQPPHTNINNLSFIAGTGAGQVRSNGCFIARYNRETIERAIGDSLNRVSKDVNPNSVFVLGSGAFGKPPKTTINVICSMSGGTGSGMLVDVLYMIQNAIKAKGMQNDTEVIPWIVMPDVFKRINPAGAFNVYHNTYGTLLDLDFLYHNVEQRPMSIGGKVYDQKPFHYAYLMNDVNKGGTSFERDDIYDVVAKCAFLPSGDMGDKANVMNDNVKNNLGSYVIGGKQAWAASASSAELIYDNRIMGQATAYALSEKLCLNLLNSSKIGRELRDNFVVNEAVIQEDDGDLHNDVINAIYNLDDVKPREVTDTTDVAEIQKNFENAKNDCVNLLVSNCDTKLKTTREKLKETLQRLICDRDCGLKAAADFLAELSSYIDRQVRRRNEE